ncbi:MAG: LCP family protein [Anaerolineaceae bacterium]|nr:LCP family protein [Anaerolineaceae bacterium]
MRIPSWLFVVGLAVVVLFTGLFSVLAFSIARQVAIDAGRSGIQFVSPEQSVQQNVPTPTPPQVAVINTVQPGIPTTTPDLLLPTPTIDPAAELQWSDPHRFTLLILGIDQRSAVNEPGPFRSDTMIIISVDPVKKTAGVLSIPRDLWVTIPGFQQARINTANYLGDSNAYPGGGPALAAETIRQNLGIEIDKYLLVNFDVFTRVVDTLAPNGVEICVQEVIDDPDYPDAGYGTIHVHFDPGCQVLDAEQLLQYARTRATEGSDFDRANRQQEVMREVLNNVLTIGGLSNALAQVPTLWTELTGSFKTNLTLDEILRMATLAGEINQDNIHFGVIDNLYVDLGRTTAGDQVLIPRLDLIRTLVQQVLYAQDDLSLAELRQRAENENASITVFNNTDILGLAAQTRDWLTGRGIIVNAIDNTPEQSNVDTFIQVYTGKIWTGRYLAALMGIPADRVHPGGDGLTANDIGIMVGPDIQSILAGG